MDALRTLFPTRASLSGLLAGFPRARIAVAGDYFLDRYLVIDPQRAEQSVETGLVAHQVVAVRNSPGAAGTIVNNLAALGAGQLVAVGVIGDDGYGFELRRQLRARRVDVEWLVGAADRLTPTYTKPLLREGTAEREIERLDFRNRAPTPTVLEDLFLAHLEAAAASMDALIVLDQVSEPDCGVVTGRVRERLLEIAARHPGTIVYADSRAFIDRFAGVIVKANQQEAMQAGGLADTGRPNRGEVPRAAAAMFARTGKPVFVTLGERGILVTSGDGSQLVPGCPVAGPIDVTGAGDSATAAIVLSLCAGADLVRAAMVGNLVASITVQQLGTTGTASPEQLLSRYDELLDQ